MMANPSAKRSARRRAAPQAAIVKHDPGRWAVAAVLVIATLVTFGRVCGADFTTWDDNLNVSRNVYLNPPTLAGLAHFWVSPHMALYVPITYTVWSVLAAVARVDTPDPTGIWLNPFDFHAANLLVHLIAVLIAYQLLLSLTHRRWPSCAGALLFALHPVQVESIAWVAGMKDVLCGMFSLLALWQYVQFAQEQPDPDRSPPAPRSWLHYGLATASLVLAMLSKPSAMVVPFAALVLDRWIIGRSWQRIATALWPWALLSLACAIVATLVQPVASPPDGGRIWARPLLAGAGVAFDLYKLVLPISLAVQYHYSPQVLLAGRWIFVAWTIPFSIAIGLWLLRRRARWLVVSAALFVIPTLPVLGFVPFQFERLSLTADHYLYLSMSGPALALAFWLSLLSSRWLKLGRGLAAVGLTLLAIRSNLQTAYWENTQTLFEHELAVNPSSEVAYNNLATLALDQHQPESAKLAEQLAQASIRSNPNQAEAYSTLGNALVRQHRDREAFAPYRTAIQNDPDAYPALTSLSALLAQDKQFPEAMRLCTRAIEIEPTYEKAHLNMAVMLANQNRLGDAIKEATIAVQLDPADAQAQSTLGNLLKGAGRSREAAERLREALRLNPNLVGARQALESLH